MTVPFAPPRNFLFLQGPPGSFFWRLSEALRKIGHRVVRVNLCGGDRFDWPEGGLDYRGTMAHWPMFFHRLVQREAVTDLVLYGDCRPMHQIALRMAQLRGIHIHVFEEGYIRPHWMTLERDGVNGHSPLERDPQKILSIAKGLAPVPQQEPVLADAGRRARESYWHYHHVVTGLLRFPFYRTHRHHRIIAEGLGWLFKLSRRGRRARQADETLSRLGGRPYFLFPLQLTGDYQIRAHSPFGSMDVAIEFVLESFAQFSPPDAILLIKEHPLDSGLRNWKRMIDRMSRRLGITGRVFHIDGGDIGVLAENALGMVCVNSTSGTLALEARVPVVVLGEAVYDVPGITHQSGLDEFWSRPEAPDRTLYESWKRILHAKCLVHGGVASESGLDLLVRNSVERLLSDPVTSKQQGSGLTRQEMGLRLSA